MLLLTALSFSLVSIVFIWSVFFWATLIFMWLLSSTFFALIIYFIVQEVCGFLFLLGGANNLSLWSLLINTGGSPFHFWVFPVVGSLKALSLLWFNTVQKTPYIAPLTQLLHTSASLVLVFGSLLIFTQIIMVKSFGVLFTLGSIESLNSGLLFSMEDASSSIFVLMFYWFGFWFCLSFNSTITTLTSTEGAFWIISFPLGLPFYLNLLVLSGLSISGWSLLLILLACLSLVTIVWSLVIVASSHNLSLSLGTFWPLLFLYPVLSFGL